MFNIDEELPAPRAGHALKLAGIASLFVLLVVAGYVYLNRVEPPAAGELLAVRCYIPQAPLAVAAADGGPPAEVPSGNRLLVLVPVKVQNTSKKPMSVQDFSGIVRLGDTDYQSYAASFSDFDKVFQFYPDLAGQYRAPFSRHDMIQPGGSQEGLLIFNYALTEEQWNHAASFEVNVSFDQRPEILHLKWATFPAHELIPSHAPAPPVPEAKPHSRARVTPPGN
jgi:hypothetical protein